MKLLFLVTEDWYFCSHRMALAQAAQASGYAVSVLCRVKHHGDVIRDAGFELIDLPMRRGGLNPAREWMTLVRIWQVYRRLKPDLVHQVAVKPVVYGSLAAWFLPTIKQVNLLAGLGTVFSARHWKTSVLKFLLKRLFRWLLRQPHVITVVQNRQDYAVLTEQLGLLPQQVRLIKGSGVDIEQFGYSAMPPPPLRLALVSRLLWDKGIAEFVAAARLLKQKGLQFQALLVGEPDEENIRSIGVEQLKDWQDEGVVDCVGRIDDVAAFWRSVHIAVLPSYREGLPKTLLEAAASGRPIITTDTAGCNEIVEHEVNGLLVPVRSVPPLADALERLVSNPALCAQMGKAGRTKVETEFANALVFAQTLAVYRELFND
ncbi:MAG: glycosyltransferase family 4 protein [Methylomonas sp.]|nr:glycosyltransferase family 4 protein [Methylomonas sp.]